MKQPKYNWTALVLDIVKVVLAFLAGNSLSVIFGFSLLT